MSKGYEYPEYKGKKEPYHEPYEQEEKQSEHQHHHSKNFKKSCHVNTTEEISITTPVTIHGHAYVGGVEIACAGHEIIKESRRRHGHKQFKICQKFRAHIPITFVAECEIEDERIHFEVEEE